MVGQTAASANTVLGDQLVEAAPLSPTKKGKSKAKTTTRTIVTRTSSAVLQTATNPVPTVSDSAIDREAEREGITLVSGTEASAATAKRLAANEKAHIRRHIALDQRIDSVQAQLISTFQDITDRLDVNDIVCDTNSSTASTANEALSLARTLVKDLSNETSRTHATINRVVADVASCKSQMDDINNSLTKLIPAVNGL